MEGMLGIADVGQSSGHAEVGQFKTPFEDSLGFFRWEKVAGFSEEKFIPIG